MTYPESIQFLYRLGIFGLNLGLENTFKLASLAGNPQANLRFIHVAGTNGKGSTCAMLESIYREAGLRVGLFTSPHLVSFRERIQINRQLISEANVARILGELQPLLAQFPPDHQPTFFEVVTVMALRYLAEERCDLVIWETGLGGRLDATNIVTPLASVITNIHLDHQKWLGDTLAAIAGEKAGIIKPGIPVVTGTDEPDAFEVMRGTAHHLGAPFEVVTHSDAEHELHQLAIENGKSVNLALPGEHQRLNAGLATTVVRILSHVLPVPNSAIRAGLETVRWPGRLELIRSADGERVHLLDGAHNPSGAEVLRSALEQSFPGRAPTLVLGVLADKDCDGICRVLAPLAQRILLVPVSSDRTAPPEVLRERCLQTNPRGPVKTCASLAEALKESANDPFVLITGSLYLVGEAKELLQPDAVQGVAERGLNDWRPKP